MANTKILIDDIDKTNLIRDYYINKDGNYRFSYKSGKKCVIDSKRVEITPRKIYKFPDDEILIYNDKVMNNVRETTTIGDKVTKVFFKNSSPYYFKTNNIKVIKAEKVKYVMMYEEILIDGAVKEVELIYYYYNYVKIKNKKTNDFSVYEKSKFQLKVNLNNNYSDFLKYYKEIADIKDKDTAVNSPNYLAKQVDSINISENSALNCFLSQKTNKVVCEDDFTIYPFGINLSQRDAIKNVYHNQLTLIQGPPGTGKTASILNIIVNLILREKKIAVVSSNNEAVKNVQEKMQKLDYGFLVSLLGNHKNRDLFFSEQPSYPSEMTNWIMSDEDLNVLKEDIISYENSLIINLEKQNELSMIEEQLREYTHEYTFFEEYLVNNDSVKLKNLSFLKLSKSKLIELIVELDIKGVADLNIINKVTNFFKYGIYEYKQFEDNIEAIVLKLNMSTTLTQLMQKKR